MTFTHEDVLKLNELIDQRMKTTMQLVDQKLYSHSKLADGKISDLELTMAKFKTDQNNLEEKFEPVKNGGRLYYKEYKFVGNEGEQANTIWSPYVQ